MLKQALLDKGLVARSFEQASSHYNQFTSMQRIIGDRLMSEVVDSRAGVRRVLDIGAGTGYLTNKLVALYPLASVHAVDISSGMLAQTRQHVKAAQSLQLVCSDADNLSFTGASMDAVFSNVAFQWCGNLSRTFAEAYAVLKHGGQFAFSTFGPKTLYELKAAWASADDAVHVNSFATQQSIEEYLHSVGFRRCTVHVEDVLMYYSSPRELMVGLKGMGAHNINQGRQQGLTGVGAYKVMLSEYEKRRTRQGIPATFQAIYVSAYK